MSPIVLTEQHYMDSVDVISTALQLNLDKIKFLKLAPSEVRERLAWELWFFTGGNLREIL